SEEHTSELQSLTNLVCRLLLEKKKKNKQREDTPTQHVGTATPPRARGNVMTTPPTMLRGAVTRDADSTDPHARTRTSPHCPAHGICTSTMSRSAYDIPLTSIRSFRYIVLLSACHHVLLDIVSATTAGCFSTSVSLFLFFFFFFK